MITDEKLRKKIDYTLLIVTLALCVFGEIILYTVTRGDKHASYHNQLIWMVIGAVGLVLATKIDYHIFLPLAKPLYVLNLLLLASVLVLSHRTNGSARWIKLGPLEFQPSESAKLIIILFLASYLVHHRQTIHTLGKLLQSLVLVIIPTLFIFKQPDLGTALVVMVIWAGMVYMAGAKSAYLISLFAGGLILFVLLWNVGNIIKPYQKQRIEVLLGHNKDDRTANYQVNQASLAIGSGEMWGKGLMHGRQVRGGYIPEKQTDFIFTAVAEQTGFTGCLFLLLLYFVLILRISTTITAAGDDIFGRLIATGILTMIAFHIAVNVGMNIGILPVAGVPLPFISAGGSNLLVTLFCIGILQSIRVNRHELIF